MHGACWLLVWSIRTKVMGLLGSRPWGYLFSPACMHENSTHTNFCFTPGCVYTYWKSCTNNVGRLSVNGVLIHLTINIAQYRPEQIHVYSTKIWVFWYSRQFCVMTGFALLMFNISTYCFCFMSASTFFLHLVVLQIHFSIFVNFTILYMYVKLVNLLNLNVSY